MYNNQRGEVDFNLILSSDARIDRCDASQLYYTISSYEWSLCVEITTNRTWTQDYRKYVDEVFKFYLIYALISQVISPLCHSKTYNTQWTHT